MKVTNIKRQIFILIFLLFIVLMSAGVFFISLNKGLNNRGDIDVTTTNIQTPSIDVSSDIIEEKVEVVTQQEEVKETENNVENKTSIEKELSDLQTPEPIVPKESEETVKSEPPKNTPKTNSDLTDKSKIPTYEEKEINPQGKTPQAGDKNDKGQIYIPGFGWVKDEGEENKTTDVDSEGDINKQVGTMD